MQSETSAKEEITLLAIGMQREGVCTSTEMLNTPSQRKMVCQVIQLLGPLYNMETDMFWHPVSNIAMPPSQKWLLFRCWPGEDQPCSTATAAKLIGRFLAYFTLNKVELWACLHMQKTVFIFFGSEWRMICHVYTLCQNMVVSVGNTYFMSLCISSWNTRINLT